MRAGSRQLLRHDYVVRYVADTGQRDLRVVREHERSIATSAGADDRRAPIRAVTIKHACIMAGFCRV